MTQEIGFFLIVRAFRVFATSGIVCLYLRSQFEASCPGVLLLQLTLLFRFSADPSVKALPFLLFLSSSFFFTASLSVTELGRYF